MTEKYGPTLVHAHFVLKHHQALVEVSGASTPWTLMSSDKPGDFNFKKYGGSIKPSAWMVSGRQLIPFEFYFTHDNEQHREPDLEPSFVKEFISILETQGLTSVIGLRLVRDPHHRSIEATEGLANVTIPFTQDADALVVSGRSKTLETGWKYPAAPPSGDNINNRKVLTKAVCWWQCVKEKGTHVAKHTS